ncbi:hypothetical protein [Bythopirellula polymerisocia]|uniref:SMP-30/Gluconolaconase/LRE-like region n=1 Tax=Bythopirellula polymerisocia TaxID=2528003 RepID=A0A5C6CKH5_9BACT|nr:hypothetical protein [Bythopirellula polymerisocia]TWU23801.1 hypothetical protein Pla144_39760 [Bythopirellula polymerisocia]
MKAVVTLAAAICLFFGEHTTASAQVSLTPAGGDESARHQTEVILEGLDNPCGLALRPAAEKDSTDEFYFAESAAGRVLRFSLDSPSDTREVLSGLATHSFGNQNSIEIGPWSLGFLTPSKLIVVGGVLEESKEHAGVYVLPANGETLVAEQTDHTVGPLADSSDGNTVGFHNLAMGETVAYFSSGTGTVPGQIYYCALEANRLDSFRPLLKNQEMRSPVGICLSPVNSAGSQFLVATDVGDLQETRDSRLVFLSPISGTKLMQLETGLFDLVGLAYSPSGQIYAIDFAWQKTKEGGVYRLDDARWECQPACRAVKIASIFRPTSMVFASDGSMLVTSFGSGAKPNQGTIIKITGEF